MMVISEQCAQLTSMDESDLLVPMGEYFRSGTSDHRSVTTVGWDRKIHYVVRSEDSKLSVELGDPTVG
jgi:hypothetical protein